MCCGWVFFFFWFVFLLLKHKHGVVRGVGDDKKTHSQGFPHTLGFMPHIVTMDVRSDFPSPCGKRGKKQLTLCQIKDLKVFLTVALLGVKRDYDPTFANGIVSTNS